MTLSYPKLKGLWVYGQFKVVASEVEDLFEAILQNQALELLTWFIYGSEYFFNYHKLAMGSPISTSLRILHIPGQHLTERGMALFGKSLRFNSVIEEISVYPSVSMFHRKYSQALLYFAASNVRVICSIPMVVMSFFFAAIMLEQSKVDTFFLDCTLQEHSRWGKYLIGVVCKLHRDVTVNTAARIICSSDSERSLLSYLN